MIVAGSNQLEQKRATPFCPRQSPVGNSPVKLGTPTTTATTITKKTRSSGCCGGFSGCIGIGSLDQRQPTSKLGQQVAELEREVVKQKELRIVYRKRMERTQDYLKYCLQVAQDNGFLDLIITNKDDQGGNPLSTMNASPQLPIPVQQHSALAVIINKAKMNGWYIEHHEIELLEKIGQGTTAEIYRAIWRGLDVAVKCINPDFFKSNESGETFFAQELDTLSRQRHRFVLHLMGACIDPPNHAWMVTEVLGMTLKEWLHGAGTRRKERSIPLPPFKKRIEMATEIAQAMQYLHEQKPKVIHRDLKPSNIFLDDSNHIRVADFGHARFLDEEEKALTGETGTYVYMAPEVIRCEPYDEKCDVYSFGIILNELMTGVHPYSETDYGPSQIGMEVAEGNLRPTLHLDDGNDRDGELISLICLAWDQDPSLRPTFATFTSNLRKIQSNITSRSV